VSWNSTHNEYLVIWDTYTEDGYPDSPYSIGYRRVGGDSIPGAGGWITTGNSPEGSDLVYNPLAGEYFIVYSRIVNDITQEINVYGARLNREVSFARSPYIIDPSTKDQINPSVATIQTNYGVTFQEFNTIYTQWGVFLHCLDSDGDFINGFGTFFSTFDLKYPKLAADSNNQEWLWVYQREAEAGNAIDGYRFSTSPHSFFVTEDHFQIYYLYWNNRTPAVAGGDQGYLVTYTGRSSYDPNTWQHIYATKYWQSGIFMPLSMR
jgi:hypothetical protein